MSDYDAAFNEALKGGGGSPYDDLMQSLMGQVKPTVVPENAQPAVKAGAAINDTVGSIPRQLGLTARYGMEGLANTAQMVTEPVRQLITDPISRMFGGKGGRPVGEEATRFADYLGLPKPETPDERVVGDASRLVAGSGGLAGAAGAAGRLPGMVGQAGQFLSQGLPSQLGSAAGAGLAGGASREAGGSPLQQGGAALVGSVLGGFAPAAGSSLLDAGKRLMTKAVPALEATPQQLDAKISVLFERGGMDYSQVPEKVRQSLRQDLSRAFQTGQELDPDAVRRLADFRMTGLTPTRGAITQDPVQITREMNLAKTGANSADGELQGLARVQNQNNARLIKNLNEAGAAQGDPFRAGEVTLGSIIGTDNRLKRDVSSLYKSAEQIGGGNIPLERRTLVDNIYGELARKNRMAFLPKEVDDYIQQFSAGVISKGGQQHQVPFDANALDNLLTTIATAQRGTRDGNVKAALSAVRDAIDKTPLQPVKNTFGGNQLVTQQGAQFLQGQDAKAGQFMDALNQARQAHAARMNWQESSKPVEAAINGAQPDKFFKQFVLNGSVEDARAFAQHVPREEARNAILAHLKEQSLSGAKDEVGKVSQSALNKAINGIGDRKLSLFFTPEELNVLKANARVASYTQVQPAGSAVGNSNTGAVLLGKGIDALAGLANSFPVVGPMVTQPLTSGIKNLNISLRQQQAQNILPGLLSNQPRPPIGQSLLLPGMAVGGLLSSPQ